MLSQRPAPINPAQIWQFGRVRRVFWMLLAAAVLLSLATPVWVLWRASTTDLEASACLWPPAPRAGTVAQVLIVMPADAAPASLTHSAQDVRVVATMPRMAMAPQLAHQMAVPRLLNGWLALATPIRVEMAGAWTARVTLQPPGHAAWQDVITFQVGAAPTAGWTNLPMSAQGAITSPACQHVQAGQTGASPSADSFTLFQSRAPALQQQGVARI